MAAKSDTDKKRGKKERAVKVRTPEQEQHKSLKDAERERKRPVPTERGSNLTMPEITWEWMAEVMSSRWPNTRKVRTVDAVLARGRTKPAAPATVSERNGK